MTEGDHPPPATAPLVPDYARPLATSTLQNLPYLTIATWCGALPLMVGTTVFVLWLLTNYRSLQGVGLFTIVGGFLLFLVGALCLVLDAGRSLPAADRNRRRWKRLGVALLLLTNFPAAFVFIGVAARIEFSVSITVQNVGTAPIESFVVIAPGVRKELGPIPAGAERFVRFQPTGDGAVEYTMTLAGETSSGTLIDYVSAGMGDRCTVLVSGPSVTVVPNRR
jgi:hypothetical protein